MRLLVIMLIAATVAACNRPVQQKDFESVHQATHALVNAAGSGDTRALLEVLGPEARPMVDSGDPVEDKNARQRFVRAYGTAHSFITDEAGVTTLLVGTDKWPFPYPLIQSDGRWRFDSPGGAQEIINRRVGANELATIQSCLAFVDAQREYYVRNPQRAPLLHYARTLLSTPGKKDGLYWSTPGDEPPSPLGERFARARSEGYFAAGSGKGRAFHGYIYRLLTAQGPNAAGGAYNYMVGDKLLGGFALVAFPAEYGSSGVMTFIVNQDGVVFSKDLGPKTHKIATAMKSFDPDRSWRREAAIER